MAERLHSGTRTRRAVLHDLRHTMTTVALGTLTGFGTTLLVLDGVIPLTTAWPTATQLVREVALYVVLFDAYFYALHRLLHTRVLYRTIHAVHHRSRAPGVLTALAFHPVEGSLIIAFMPAAICLIPTHLASLVVTVAFLSGSILFAHSGWEVFPAWWCRVPLLNWYVTPRVHDAHHVRRNCNYGATLSIFDRAFGTLGDTRRRPG
jgi:sterol desaturase/sphingolipid hydroxylase (fatty acid hydroxylase superfamily)